MDDVLDRVRLVHHTRDILGHFLLVVSLLLRDQDLVHSMGAVAGDARLLVALQKSRPSVVDRARERNRRAHREDETTRLLDVLAALLVRLSLRLESLLALGRQGPIVARLTAQKVALAQRRLRRGPQWRAHASWTARRLGRFRRPANVSQENPRDNKRRGRGSFG